MPDDRAAPPARTTLRRAEDATFDAGLRGFFAYRDLGIRGATAGGFGAHVIRAVPGEPAAGGWHAHDLAFQMVYVVCGWVRFEYEDLGEVRLVPGDCVHQPPGVRHRELGHSDDLELLEITAPAEFTTRTVGAPEVGGAGVDGDGAG